MEKFKQSGTYLGIFVLLFFAITYALSLGIVKTSYFDTLHALSTLLYGGADNSITNDVIQYLRMPRFITALLIGCGLAVCGTVMQAVMKNPLADPYLLGLASGAGLGAVLAITAGLDNFMGFNCVGLFAFGGALTTTIFILLISIYYGRTNSLAVLLSGMAFNAICSALISFIITIYADAERIQSVTFWLMGSLLNSNWPNISALFAVVLSVTFFFCIRYRILDLMLWGDEASLTMGYDLTRERRLYILLCALVVGLMVYNAGIIGFVGLIIPHIARLISGSRHLRLLPLSAILGATFLAWADVLSRTVIEGSEIPIGIVVALFGAPVFVYLLLNKKYRYGK